MMAKALENNGATVYIVGRRKEVLDVAVREHSVRSYLAFGVGHFSLDWASEPAYL
jgi:NADP-dependent 3-hydroxy acid dehydrogenase YdfG